MEDDKKREQERLTAIQAENERLRREKQELENQARQPPEALLE
jgi:hypothetical protein